MFRTVSIIVIVLAKLGDALNPLIEAYIKRFPQDIQARHMRIREIFLSEVPDATEDIKYQMPTIIWYGNLIHYAAFKNHIGIYPLPDVLVTLNEEIKGYKTGKGSIQFQNSEPLPEDLIRLIVKTRIEEKKREIALK